MENNLMAELSFEVGFLEGVLCDPSISERTRDVIKKRVHKLTMLLISEGAIK